MTKQKSAANEGKSSGKGPSLNQYSNVEGITISFRTMPKDLEFLLAKSGESAPALKTEQPAVLPPLPASAPKPIPPPAPPPPPPAPETTTKPFLSKLAHPDIETEEKLEEIKIKKAAKKEQAEKKEKAKALHKEAKSLFRRRFYQEANNKLEELLKIKPNHWRGQRLLKRSGKKLAEFKKAYSKAQAETEKIKQQLAERIKIEEAEKKEMETRLGQETEIVKQKEAQLQQSQQEKLAIERQMEKIQDSLARIRQDSEERARQEFSQQLQADEEKIRLEHQARIMAEKELESLQQEKAILEKRLRQESKAMLASQKEIELQAQQEAEKLRLEEEAKRQEELLKAEKERLKQEETLKQKVAPEEIAQAQPAFYSPPTPAMPVFPEAMLETEVAREKRSSALFPLLKSLAKRLLAPKLLEKAGLALLALVVISGTIYFIGLWRTQPGTKQPAPGPTTIEEVPPQALFSIDATEKITLQAGQKKNLFQELTRLSEKKLRPGSFTRILIETISQSQEKKYIALPDLIDSLGISFPPEALSSLGNDYTFFLYAQKETPAGPFLAGLGKNKLGLVISISKKNKINQQFTDWEKTMPDDLDALFLGKKISFSTTYQFEETTYQNTTIRSLALPNQFSSINYAFYNNKALITTSAESIKSLIDRMAPSQQ